MGLQKKPKIKYLKISEGKIRAKSTKEDPNAEERYVEILGKHVYEEVYTSCTGYLRKIVAQHHEEYGTSYNLILQDVNDGVLETFSLNMGENSRYFSSFMQLIPNIDFAVRMEIKPFKFKSDGRDAIGLSITQADKKVVNYYKDWDEDTETSTYKNGLEKFDFKRVKKGDKEGLKILQLQVLKFLKEELKKHVRRLEDHVESSAIPGIENVVDAPPAQEPDTATHHDDAGDENGSDKKTSPGKKNKGSVTGGRGGKNKRKNKRDDDLPY